MGFVFTCLVYAKIILHSGLLLNWRNSDTDDQAVSCNEHSAVSLIKVQSDKMTFRDYFSFLFWFDCVVFIPNLSHTLDIG